MASDYRYLLTEKAIQELDYTIAYITDTLKNPTAAKALYAGLLEAFERLTLFPNSGTLCGNSFAVRDDFRQITVKNYTVFYWINHENKEIIIIRIVYSHRNMDDVMKNTTL